jgi:CheY-like chemotaxis protein
MSLDGTRVLVVEDEFLIALDLTTVLREAGASVVGPAHSASEALDLLETAVIDVAVLDLDLGGHWVDPVAERCAALGIPFVFHSGRGLPDAMRARFAGVPLLEKPAGPNRLIAEVVALT